MTARTRTSSSATDRATAYAKSVVSGKVIAGPHIRNACRRHLDDLKHGKKRGLHYDLSAADRAIRFFEERLKLSDGQFEGTPFKLHPSQAFKTGSIFGWKRADGTRRFRRAYIEEGKGNGKSPWVAGVGLYGLTADGEAGAEIYAAASKKDQAQVLFRDAIKMFKAAPTLKQRLTASGGDGKEHNLAYLAKASFFRPISREAGRTGSGPRPHFALADEIHEMTERSTVEMLERGFKFRRQPLLAMITNSGSDRNSFCWEQHEHAIRVAAGNPDAKDDDPHYLGEPLDDNTFSFVCSLDPGDDPLEDPSCWPKANPLLGVTITEDYLADVVKQAKQMPGAMNGILRLHFCVWTDAETAWMTRAVLEPCLAEFDPAEHHGKRAFLGLDLSQTKDITAKAIAVQTGVVETGEHAGKPIFDAWIEAWTPGDTVQARALRDKLDYQRWIREGHLLAPNGATISYRHVAQSIAEDNQNFDIACLAFDRYAFARMLQPELDELGLTIDTVEHPQGGTKKGKPSEAMKEAAKAADREPEGLWMPMSVRQLEELLLERRIRLKTNPVLISAMMSAVTDEDRWGNYWLAKERAVNKIDAAVALCMAVGAAIAHEGDTGSVYKTRGLLVM
ncbi:MAG: terminase large subunit [Sphingobium sp.]